MHSSSRARSTATETSPILAKDLPFPPPIPCPSPNTLLFQKHHSLPSQNPSNHPSVSAEVARFAAQTLHNFPLEVRNPSAEPDSSERPVLAWASAALETRAPQARARPSQALCRVLPHRACPSESRRPAARQALRTGRRCVRGTVCLQRRRALDRHHDDNRRGDEVRLRAAGRPVRRAGGGWGRAVDAFLAPGGGRG